ncbi:MAG: MATE family efflux transporter [Clostridiales bacterium]|nr:MATE family efflux transporter [Clostridiales bacterium]
MTQEKNAANQITEGVIWKQLLLFFFPIVLGTFFQQLYNTADTVVVGRFVGKEALASVGGSSAQIVGLIVGFFVGLASGATVIISQFYGARDKNQVSRSLHTAFAFSIVGSVFITILGIISAPWLLRIMNTPENLMADSILYLRIYFAGILFVFIYNVGSSILRAVGDSKRPLYYLIVCCILNIVLDIVLVIVFHMGVSGVSIATVFSQAVSAVLIIRALMKSDDIYHLNLREIRFHKAALLSLIWIGLPTGIQSIMYSCSNMFIQASLNTYGTDTMAAWTAFGKIDALYWMINSAFGIAVTTFVGQNLGAGRYDRMKKSVRVGIAMALTTALLITGFLFVAGRPLFRMFTTDNAVVDIGMQMLHVIAPAYFLFVFVELLSGALRGTGDVVIPMLMTCGGICLLRVLWIIFIVPLKPGLETIIFSYPVTWFITAGLFVGYYVWRVRKCWR